MEKNALNVDVKMEIVTNTLENAQIMETVKMVIIKERAFVLNALKDVLNVQQKKIVLNAMLKLDIYNIMEKKMNVLNAIELMVNANILKTRSKFVVNMGIMKKTKNAKNVEMEFFLRGTELNVIIA